MPPSPRHKPMNSPRNYPILYVQYVNEMFAGVLIGLQIQPSAMHLLLRAFHLLYRQMNMTSQHQARFDLSRLNHVSNSLSQVFLHGNDEYKRWNARRRRCIADGSKRAWCWDVMFICLYIAGPFPRDSYCDLEAIVLGHSKNVWLSSIPFPSPSFLMGTFLHSWTREIWCLDSQSTHSILRVS
jgi:hypothetical protein